jgi:NADH-quinone oxidoreductase subunit L
MAGPHRSADDHGGDHGHDDHGHDDHAHGETTLGPPDPQIWGAALLGLALGLLVVVAFALSAGFFG